MRHPAVIKRVSLLLLLLGPATTLAVSPFSSFDPINLVKMIVVAGIAFSVLALLFAEGMPSLKRIPKGVWLAAAFFVGWMTLVLITSEAPMNQQFWGVFGRNNGYLGYFCLIVILVGVALIQDKSFYHKLVDVLILTAIPTTIYAVFQAAGLDPVSWSVMQPFATLGNINFSSAFFGLASICATIIALSPRQNPILRMCLGLLVITDLYIILQTGSIQGFMIYIAGMGIAGYFLVRSIGPLKIFRMPYLVLGFSGFAMTALALNNIGPLARFVFSETILYRFDYWYAGWAMSIKNPIFGVGLDSYGDWYRELRGVIATTRTGPDRITNTAHNIYLDISASGGFPLLLAYFVLLGYAFRASFRVIRRENFFNPYFVALFATWIAYLIQAAISINQIGVGIWGWLFTGALIGYEIATREQSRVNSSKKVRVDAGQLPAFTSIVGILGFFLGASLAFIPYNADSNFKKAIQFGDPREQFVQAKALGATAFHLELSLDAALRVNDQSLVRSITDELLSRYPRDFMAWRVRQVLETSTPKERTEAYERLRQLDPYNLDIKPY